MVHYLSSNIHLNLHELKFLFSHSVYIKLSTTLDTDQACKRQSILCFPHGDKQLNSQHENIWREDGWGILEEEVEANTAPNRNTSRQRFFLFSSWSLIVCTAGLMRLSSWRATLPGPLVCLWQTWWKASRRTCTKCTLCPLWSRWGDYDVMKFIVLITSHKHTVPVSNILKWPANRNLTVFPSSYRACTEWRTRSSSASPVSWATAAWQTWFTWHWSQRRSSSWWRALRPCGAYRRSSLCEEHSSESSSPPWNYTHYSAADSLSPYLLCPSGRMRPLNI